MSLVVYSQCRIRFVPNDRQDSVRDYSDRTLVELRQHDFSDYILRALNVDKNKQVGKLKI